MPEPRIAPLVDPSPEVDELLDKTKVRQGPPLNIFATMAHHPRLLKRFNVLGGLFLLAGYTWALTTRMPRPVASEFVAFHRAEQMARLRRMIWCFGKSAKDVKTA